MHLGHKLSCFVVSHGLLALNCLVLWIGIKLEVFWIGLSDEARADFGVMKDVGAHTRVPPEGRNRTLQGFINQINQ